MDNQVNTTNKKDKSTARIDKTNSILDEEVVKQLKELDTASSDLDAVIEIMIDRVILSTDATLAIALARFMEIKLDTFKKRNDIIKTLVSDKSIEVGSKKRTPMTDLESILSGASLGAALGAAVTTQKSLDKKKQEQEDFITVDMDEPMEFEVVDLTPNNKITKEDIDNLLNR